MWRSLDTSQYEELSKFTWSQCTYRCVVLPDCLRPGSTISDSLSQCTYRCVVLPDASTALVLMNSARSQCTYRCVVLPDMAKFVKDNNQAKVSMHLQVRGAP